MTRSGGPHGANAHDHHGSQVESPPFNDLLREVLASADGFGHRQHVHLTWLAVRRYGTAAAVGIVSDGLRATARYHGAPQKYNATVSRAWVELVGHHAAEVNAPRDFDTFADRHAVLLDKRLLSRFYTPATLASSVAKAGWVEPDRAAFPWQHAPAEPGVGHIHG